MENSSYKHSIMSIHVFIPVHYHCLEAWIHGIYALMHFLTRFLALSVCAYLSALSHRGECVVSAVLGSVRWYAAGVLGVLAGYRLGMDGVGGVRVGVVGDCGGV